MGYHAAKMSRIFSAYTFQENYNFKFNYDFASAFIFYSVMYLPLMLKIHF